ncbi:MAG: DUF924 domain-containing protein [Pseudomonadota bacterium]|nr:DUF924 domain-containing protein [Pseudomonadota bacterium]
MGGDLMADERQVHEQAREVLDFWFGLDPKLWWEKDDAFDAEVAARFGALRAAVAANEAAGWRGHPDTLLGAIILLDQFSRNICRGRAEAFAADDLAVRLTLEGIGKGWDERYPPDRRAFFYMPLMHAEDAPLQALSVETFDRLGIANNAAFARDHRDIFTRFGRFPGRNAALERTSTAAEDAYLAAGGGW